jgi:hypothetical protein
VSWWNAYRWPRARSVVSSASDRDAERRTVAAETPGGTLCHPALTHGGSVCASVRRRETGVPSSTNAYGSAGSTSLAAPAVRPPGRGAPAAAPAHRRRLPGTALQQHQQRRRREHRRPGAHDQPASSAQREAGQRVAAERRPAPPG